MYDNTRSVGLFNIGENDMNRAIADVGTRKGLLGHKNVDNNVFKAEMNRISRDNPKYSAATVEYKLLDLFWQAATKIIDERYENIN